jgi:DNA repair exonuclease SbcCD nuclease subunit
VAFTLVHCADVHLETTFPDTRGGAARRTALADAFVRIVDEALARQADVLTIGGDLYEAERAGPATVRFLFEQFVRFGKPVFLAPGNHDPHAPGSLLARPDLPENVLVFNEAAWRAIPLADGITLYGFGHTPAEPGRPFASARFERGGVQIALVHGSDEARCPPNKRATAPFTQREVSASGASILLTGHYHGGYLASEHGRTAIAYPGSPEPIKFGEGLAHGIVALRIEGNHIDATLVPIARTRLFELDCDLSGVGHEHAAAARIEKVLSPLGRRDYVRLRLTGQTAHGTRLEPGSLRERFESALGSLELSDRTSSFDYELISREPTVRGHVVRDLLALARDDGSELAGEALRYALAAFDGAEIAP